ncbi:hypothetical protein QYF36_011854 [Acer negundo]|nr:hypothetical protein QYF36_011854 [Acer negundo]
MTIFKDGDGAAYLVYSSEDNSELHIGPLTSDYLDVTNFYRRVLVGQHREAPALFKHKIFDADVDIIGVGCYSSKDLWTWRNEGIVLAAEETNETHDL